MHDGVVIKKTVTFATRARGKRVLDVNNLSFTSCPPGRVPRITRLMALAIKLDGILAAGRELSQTDLAELGHVTKARMTQILNLTLLSPEIQAEILDLPLVTSGHDPISESDLRPLCAMVSWRQQRGAWARMVDTRRGSAVPNTSTDGVKHHNRHPAAVQHVII
ncbi:MAG: hypothetical protein IT432_04450 [Phycisphaerales bacterium]|nr:hypothetical protein [Phycisphaerales bacterium]